MSTIRMLRVTGKGMLRIRPDLTRLTLTLGGVCPEYGETLKKSSRDTEQLKDLFTELGFARSDLKTLQFDVDPEYEGYEEGGVYRQRLAGYRFRHVAKIEFASDNDRLGKILFALADSPVDPEFGISYTVRDPEAAKNQLLAAAVKDAGEKAKVLAKAAGVKLKDLQSIDYAWGQNDFEVRPVNRMLKADRSMRTAASGSFDMDIEPDDMEVTDTVTVTWEIG